MDLTPNACRLAGDNVIAWCVPCRAGRPLDLLAFEVAGNGDVPLKRLFPRMRCETCRAPASELVVSRMVVGVVEDVLRLKSVVDVVGKIGATRGAG